MGLSFSNIPVYNNFYGLFIGIEKFPRSQGSIKSLYHSNEDADELCNFFLDQCRQENRNFEISLLTNSDYKTRVAYADAATVLEGTRANILRQLTYYLKNAQANDFLLMYISTHGEIDYHDYFFIPSDGELHNLLGTGISAYTMVQALSKASGRGVKVLMIVDTCYAGAIGFDVARYKGEFSGLLSSSPVEFSHEFFDKEHGIFSYYLLKGLKGEAEKEGNVTLISLYDYIYRNVQKETQKRQNPLLIGTMNYNFSLLRTAARTPVR